MATKTEFDLFKFMYEEQQTRASELVNRGKIYLSMTTAYLGFLAFKGNELLGQDSRAEAFIAYLLSASLFVLSLLMTIWALGVYRYEIPTDPIELLENPPPTPPTDDEFREDRLADFAVATKRNLDWNEKRATRLILSSCFLLAGVIAHLVALSISTIASYVAHHGGPQ